MRGTLWRKRRQGLNQVKLGHALHTHTRALIHSHDHCQKSPVYYCWSRHYPEINKRENAKEKEKRARIAKEKEQRRRREENNEQKWN